MTTEPIVVTHPDEIGPALRDVRQAEGITQSALAETASVGRQWLNSFELGEKASAPLDMVMRLVAALDTSVVLARPPRAIAVNIADGVGVEDADAIDLDAHLREFDS